MERNEKQECGNITLELQVSMKTFDQKNVQIDAIASKGKLTKADAGRTANVTEDWLTMKVESEIGACGKFGIPKVETNYHSKG